MHRCCTPCRRMSRRGLVGAGLLAGTSLVWVPTQGAAAADERIGEVRVTAAVVWLHISIVMEAGVCKRVWDRR